MDLDLLDEQSQWLCPNCEQPGALNVKEDEQGLSILFCATPGCSHDIIYDRLMARWGEEGKGSPPLNGKHPEPPPKQPKRPVEVKAGAWDDPVELGSSELPEFPVSAFPPWVRNYVQAVAHTTQTPVDLPAMLYLSVAAMAVQRNFVVKVRDGWDEPLNIWVLVALPSGNVKTGTQWLMVDPVTDYEMKKRDELRSQVLSARAKRDADEGRLKKMKGSIINLHRELDREYALKEIVELEKSLEERPRVEYPRFYTDDVTPERLAVLMEENGGRISIMSADAQTFEIMAGRYSGGEANFGVYLMGHAGDDIRVERVSRPAINLRRPALTMGLQIQPGALSEAADRMAFLERGLLARFLFAIPKSLLGYREIDPDPVAPAVRDLYRQGVNRLLNLKGDTDNFGKPIPHPLTFDAEAREVLGRFRSWLEPQLREDGQLGAIPAWGSKLSGAMVRLAGLLHMTAKVGKEYPWQHEISGATAASAAEICHYTIAHAKAAFRLIGGDPSAVKAQKLLAWLKRHGKAQVTKRAIHRGMSKTFHRVSDLDQPLDLLIQHGYLKSLDPTTPTKMGGRPPTALFEVHPSVIAQG